MMWYLTEGRSGTRPPRTSTTECSCRLWPMPGMYGDLHLVGQAHSGDLPKRRVRLLRSHRADDRADAALLRRADAQLDVTTAERVPGRAERGRVHFLALRLASFAYELRDRWHRYSFYWWSRARTGTPLTGSRVQALTRETGEPPRAGTVVERSAAADTTARHGRHAKWPAP